MAELLVKSQSVDDTKDLTAWSRGHVVAVKPDGWEWGRLECPPKFCVVKISDATESDCEKYMRNKVDEELKVVAIRDLKFDLDDATMSKTISDSIKDTGKVTVTKSQIETFFKSTTAVAIGK